MVLTRETQQALRANHHRMVGAIRSFAPAVGAEDEATRLEHLEQQPASHWFAPAALTLQSEALAVMAEALQELALKGKVRLNGKPACR